MGHVIVSELEYAPPGADALFFDVGFTVSPGEHAALIGVNGVGKSTILRILAGELEPDEGSFSIGGTVLRMTQDVGMSSPDTTLREMLIEVAPPASARPPGGRWSRPRRRCSPARDDGVGVRRRGSPTGATSAATSWRASGRPPPSAASRRRSTTSPRARSAS